MPTEAETSTESEWPEAWYPEVWYIANLADISRDNEAALAFLNRLAGNVLERYLWGCDALSENQWGHTLSEVVRQAARDHLAEIGDLVETWSGLRGWSYSEEVESFGGYVEGQDTLSRLRVELDVVASIFLNEWRENVAEKL